MGVALRVAALATFSPLAGAAALIGAHSCARLCSSIALDRVPHAGDTTASRILHSGERMSPIEMGMAVAFAVLSTLPLAFLAPLSLIVAIPAGAALAFGVIAGARRLIGGQTGDVLGSMEQVFEIIFLLAVAGVLAAT
jgi:adenosylcobinamide-GDP ribazoletransferase